MDETTNCRRISCSIGDMCCVIPCEFHFDILWFFTFNSIYCYGLLKNFSFRSHPFDGLIQLSVTAICLFIILPLTAVGTVLGRNISGEPNVPCRTNAVPRPIPEKKWCDKRKFDVQMRMICFDQVYGTKCDYSRKWNLTIRINIYRNVSKFSK